jgi:predicted phage tail component-like protein
VYIYPTITINGVNSTSIQGLLITELPPISKPLQRTLVETIDGRDGDIVTKLGYSAYDKVVKIALRGNYNIDEVISFFDTEGEITFSNEPDKFYRFAIYEQIDYNRLAKYRTAEITIHVQPYKYLVNELVIAEDVNENPYSIRVYNAGNVNAKPVLFFQGSGIVKVNLNGSRILQIDLGSEPYTEITIDTEAMNAYGLYHELKNRDVIGNYDNIKFVKGSNLIQVNGSINYFEINKYNRWI